MVVACQDLPDHLCNVFTVGEEVVGVELVFVMDRADGTILGLAKVINAGQESVAQHTIALGGVIEGVGRCNAAVDPVALVLDVDGLAGMEEAAVLGAAAEEVLTLVFDDGLSGLAAQNQSLLLLHDDLVHVQDGHLGSGLLELDGGVPGLDDDIAAYLADGCAGVAVGIIGVGILGDPYRVAVNGGGILGERAAGVHIVAENIALQECDLTADAACKLHGDHVCARRSGLHGCQRTVRSLRFRRRNEANDHRNSKDRRKNSSAGFGDCFHITISFLMCIITKSLRQRRIMIHIYFTRQGN